MRHQVRGRHLGRTSAHRTALRRNLASSLFEHGRISTTIEKAKFVKPFAEKMITLAKKGTLHARRRAIAQLQDRDICHQENGEPVKVDTVIHKLFNEIGPRFSDRSGGYTRIVKLPFHRIGDNGRLVLLQLVDGDVVSTPKSATAAVEAPAESVEDNTAADVEEEASVVAEAEETQVTDEADDSEEKKE